jgi:small subunit ribosomal protein S4e
VKKLARLKRLTAPKWWPISKKTKKYTFATRGPHPRENSLPLTVLIRDVLKLAETGKEAETVIRKGEIMVDGRKVKDPNYGVGVFDVVEIPSMKKSWRAIPKDGLIFLEIPESEKKLKICKIVDKKTLKGNKTQLNLSDGRNIITSEKYSTQDSVLIEVPEQKIVNHLKFDKNATAIVLGGKNSGIISKIKEVEKDRAWLGEENSFEVPRRLLLIVGKDKPAIKIE